eukprot:CAMPEP_0118955376 /NCGR_PEP_ID=MMETSP1169-20130426/59871_1 /TAXON_ID=36882 /ORGANISM="Pyramimonas obovata, Strain CCMP722" /LENGTH=78 /DNA_ID=CAMNT_0006903211 /DNA_START=287 /DNA_END=519 /DNA_ORIENTATION=-
MVRVAGALPNPHALHGHAVHRNLLTHLEEKVDADEAAGGGLAPLVLHPELAHPLAEGGEHPAGARGQPLRDVHHLDVG